MVGEGWWGQGSDGVKEDGGQGGRGGGGQGTGGVKGRGGEVKEAEGDGVKGVLESKG